MIEKLSTVIKTLQPRSKCATYIKSEGARLFSDDELIYGRMPSKSKKRKYRGEELQTTTEISTVTFGCLLTLNYNQELISK